MTEYNVEGKDDYEKYKKLLSTINLLSNNDTLKVCFDTDFHINKLKRNILNRSSKYISGIYKENGKTVLHVKKVG